MEVFVLLKNLSAGKSIYPLWEGLIMIFMVRKSLDLVSFTKEQFPGITSLPNLLTVRIRGSYRNTEYIDQSDRKDKIATVGAGLRWQALEWMDIGLDYQFRSLDSTIDTNDYDENRVSVGITVFPTVPFHTSRY